jgi:hypothetical protein
MMRLGSARKPVSTAADGSSGSDQIRSDPNQGNADRLRGATPVQKHKPARVNVRAWN